MHIPKLPKTSKLSRNMFSETWLQKSMLISSQRAALPFHLLEQDWISKNIDTPSELIRSIFLYSFFYGCVNELFFKNISLRCDHLIVVISFVIIILTYLNSSRSDNVVCSATNRFSQMMHRVDFYSSFYFFLINKSNNHKWMKDPIRCNRINNLFQIIFCRYLIWTYLVPVLFFKMDKIWTHIDYILFAQKL